MNIQISILLSHTASINSAAPKPYKNSVTGKISKITDGVYFKKFCGLIHISIEAYVNTNAKPTLKNQAANLISSAWVL